MGGPKEQKIPKAPNIRKSYQEGLDVFLENLPRMLNAERDARRTTDPQRVQDFLNLQDTYGPAQTREQLERLQQFDPEGQSVRKQLGGQIYNDLRSGYRLPTDYAQELEQGIRGSQAARGNILGKGAGSAEALYKGKAALDLYQQHIDNAGQFLHTSTPQQQAGFIPAVQPDRSAGYTNPAAGLQGQQFSLNNYQNMLAQYQLSNGGSGGNAWQRALDGASKGSVGGIYGAIGGAIDGAAGSPLYYSTTSQGAGASPWFSDIRLKENIVPDGEQNGIPMYQFSFTGDDKRYRGPIAQEVLLLKPELVGQDSDGYLVVDYAAL